MELILCSLVVLVSTSKPQSMSSELLLVSDLHYDFGEFDDIYAAPNPSLQSYAPQNLAESPSFAELFSITISWNPFGFFSAIGSMYILYVKNTPEPFCGL